MRRSLTLTFAILLGCGLPAYGQAVLAGVVRDSTGRPLAGAQILLDSSATRVSTDSAGRYRLNASAGAYVAVFRMLGYRPVTRPVRLTAGDTLTTDVTLALGDAQQLEAVDVKANKPRGVGREAFEERRALGLGKFIDSTVLRRSEGRRLSELLRESGVRMWTGNFGRSYYAVNPTKSNQDGKPACYMSVFVDGVTYYRTGSPEDPPDLTKEFSIMSLEGIEVYRGSGQIPMEFAGRGTECGVIVLWTRRAK